MAGISSPGVGSGLDVKSIVDALVNADIAPARGRLDKQESALTAQLSSLGLVKSALAKLQTAITKFSTLSSFYSQKTSISDTSALNVNLDDNASNGSYEISVEKMANKQNLASTAFPSSTAAVGNGSLTIEFGTYNSDQSAFTLNADKSPVIITIAPGQNSLTAIRDSINNSNSGVTASIVQDSQGARLTLSSPQTGKDFAMRITAADSDGNNTNGTGLSALAFDPTAGVNSMTQTVAAQDSQVIINGLTLTNSTNQLKEAIQGVTIDLKKAQPGTLIYVSIEKNQAQITMQVNDFIKQYNDTMTTINSLTSYNSETKKAGPMQSDSGIRNLKFNLSKWIGESQNNDSPLHSLSDLGIKTNEKGLLSLNTEQFNKVLESNYNDIGALFAQSATATDSNVRIKNVPGTIKAGTYSVILDSFTPGTDLSGTIGGVAASSIGGLTLKGSGKLKDLSVDIIGGGIGARGDIIVKDGLASKLSTLLDDYLSDKGNLTVRTKTLGDRIKDVGSQREELQVRADSIRSRYDKQFTALDAMLAQMQSSSQFLTQQLSNLNFSQR